MGRAEIFPFAEIGGAPGQRYPQWLRDLDGRNGVYVIREIDSGSITYVGESHSSRLYGTLTRHFQHWSPKYNTAGPTYDRDQVEVAVVLVPKTHALYLQNDLICALDPEDNRLVCGETDESHSEHEHADSLPRGYDYDISRIIESLFVQSDDLDDVPF